MTYYKQPFILKKLFIYLFLFLVVLGLRCCVRAFSCCSKWGLLLVAGHGLLMAVAFLAAKHWL